MKIILLLLLFCSLTIVGQEPKLKSELLIGYTFRDNTIDFIDIDITIVNLSKKTIKYVTVYIDGFNAVDDKVGSTKIVRGIGPIKFANRGVYGFENVWLTNIVETISIPQIKIEYMDKTIKIFKKGQYMKMDIEKINEIYEKNELETETE